jgi:hypothetical protein
MLSYTKLVDNFSDRREYFSHAEREVVEWTGPLSGRFSMDFFSFNLCWFFSASPGFSMVFGVVGLKFSIVNLFQICTTFRFK